MGSASARQKLTYVLLLFFVASMWSYGPAKRVFADTQPTSSGTGFYVAGDWYDRVSWGSGTIEKAYRKGWAVSAGSSSNTWQKGMVILDFGRQFLQSPGAGWGTVLTTSGDGYESNQWVINVAQKFIDGYNDNPAHPVAIIVIATNNSDYPWTCNNNDPGSLSTNWYTSGIVWGTSVLNHFLARPKVLVHSGNDIEAYNFDNGNWVACGLGADSWVHGFMDATSSQGTLNFNFGDNAYAENTAKWTQQQLYNVSFGYRPAWSVPEIYCASTNPASVWSPPWVTLRGIYGMQFWGVTSDNGRSPTKCGGPSLAWQASWNDLNDKLTNAGYPGQLFGLGIDYLPQGW